MPEEGEGGKWSRSRGKENVGIFFQSSCRFALFTIFFQFSPCSTWCSLTTTRVSQAKLCLGKELKQLQFVICTLCTVSCTSFWHEASVAKILRWVRTRKLTFRRYLQEILLPRSSLYYLLSAPWTHFVRAFVTRRLSAQRRRERLTETAPQGKKCLRGKTYFMFS